MNGLAANADRTGRPDDGVRYARQALQEIDEGTRRGIKFSPSVLFAVPYNLAKALSEQGDFAAAAPLFDRARSAAEATRRSTSAQAWSGTTLGRVPPCTTPTLTVTPRR